MGLNYLIALGLTLILELVFALLWGIRKQDLLLVALVNMFTNPLVNMVHLLFYSNGIWLNMILPEAGTAAAEGLLYRRKKNQITSPVCFAVMANLFSCLCGILIQNVRILW